MIDREALTAALGYWDNPDQDWPSETLDELAEAARERLAQLPEFVDDPECGDCDHLPRKVYPAETVATIERALKACWHGASFRAMALVVLDALNERS